MACNAAFLFRTHRIDPLHGTFLEIPGGVRGEDHTSSSHRHSGSSIKSQIARDPIQPSLPPRTTMMANVSTGLHYRRSTEDNNNMPTMVAEVALPSSSSSGSAIWSHRRDEITFDHLHKVSNLSHLSKLARRNNAASRIDEVDKLRTVFLAMEDARAVLIKLADRLHNMRMFDSLSKIKQLCFAKETLEIFAPLANQLGVLNWKEQLENLCFKYLYPEEYEELSSNLLEFYNKDMIAAAIRQLEHALQVRGLSYHAISGRHKSMYSIYNKMTRSSMPTHCKKLWKPSCIHEQLHINILIFTITSTIEIA